MPKLSQKTIDKINEAMKNAECHNWKINKDDSRYVDFVCKCGTTDKKLKQNLIKKFTGCANCSKKGISEKVLDSCKQKCDDLGYKFQSVAKKSRSIIVLCKCNQEFTVHTSNWLRTQNGSCARCIHWTTQEEQKETVKEEKKETPIEKKGNWTGGISCGYLQETDKYVKVNFKKSQGGNGKTFHKCDYGSHTRATAIAFQKRECEKRNLTKNQVRLVTVIEHPVLPTGYEYYEMKLLQNNGRGNPKIEKCMKIETDQLELIRSMGKVRAYLKKGKKTTYALIGSNKNTKQIHNILYPQFSEVDHIDRNGLNNLRSNTREGGGRVNAQNKGKQKNNTSGHAGVEWHKPVGNRKGRWKAVWKDKEGKRKSKSFSVFAEEDKERVKALAIAHRESMAKKTREFLGM